MEVDDICNQSFATLKDYREFVSTAFDIYDNSITINSLGISGMCIELDTRSLFCAGEGRNMDNERGFWAIFPLEL